MQEAPNASQQEEHMRIGSIKSRYYAVTKLYVLHREDRYNRAVAVGNFGTWN